jgi:hypothetical protein
MKATLSIGPCGGGLPLVAVLAGWTAFEVFITQQPLWMLVAGGLFAYTAWIFLISWKDSSAN